MRQGYCKWCHMGIQPFEVSASYEPLIHQVEPGWTVLEKKTLRHEVGWQHSWRCC